MIIKEENPDITYSTKPNFGDDMNFSSKQCTTSNTIYTYKNIPTNNIEKAMTYTSNILENIGDKNYTSHYITNRDMAYTGNNFGADIGGIQDIPYTSSGAKNATYTSPGTRALNLQYSSERRNQDFPYTNIGRKNHDPSYSSSGRKNHDSSYSSSSRRNKDVPYTSQVKRNQDVPYSINGKREKDVPHTSQIQNDIKCSIFIMKEK